MADKQENLEGRDRIPGHKGDHAAQHIGQRAGEPKQRRAHVLVVGPCRQPTVPQANRDL